MIDMASEYNLYGSIYDRHQDVYITEFNNSTSGAILWPKHNTLLNQSIQQSITMESEDGRNGKSTPSKVLVNCSATERCQ